MAIVNCILIALMNQRQRRGKGRRVTIFTKKNAAESWLPIILLANLPLKSVTVS